MDLGNIPEIVTIILSVAGIVSKKACKELANRVFLLAHQQKKQMSPSGPLPLKGQNPPFAPLEPKTLRRPLPSGHLAKGEATQSTQVTPTLDTTRKAKAGQKKESVAMNKISGKNCLSQRLPPKNHI